MTDTPRRRQAPPYTRYTVRDHVTTAAQAAGAPARPARGRSVMAGRVAAAGIGIAAMVGLVANMEMTGKQAQAATASTETASAGRSVSTSAQKGATPVRHAAAKAKKHPIVLTPHTVVHAVSAPAPSGGGYVASAPAAAPVASSGGS